MATIFDLTKLKHLVETREISAIVLVDTNIVMREPDFENWKVPAKEPVFVLSDIIVLELEQVRNKPGSSESAKKAIKNLNRLFQSGNIANGIHIDDIGWFISIPSRKEAELGSQLSLLEDVVKIFGSSDTKLLLLAEESNKTIKSIPTIFATGDTNLFNIVEVNDVPAYLFVGFPMVDIDKLINKYLVTTPDWDGVLSEILDSVKNKSSAPKGTFQWFCEVGLPNLIINKSPMFPDSRRIELTFKNVLFHEAELNEESCLETNTTFSFPLFVTTRILLRETGEIKKQDLFFGDLPMVTQDGSFIINGERKNLLIVPVITSSLEGTVLDTALDSIKAKAIRRMARASVERVTPSTLINSRPFLKALDEFFSVSLNTGRYDLS